MTVRTLRWALHPLAPTLGLLVLVAAACAASLGPGRGAAPAVLAGAAGGAAGFANSGST